MKECVVLLFVGLSFVGVVFGDGEKTGEETPNVGGTENRVIDCVEGFPLYDPCNRCFCSNGRRICTLLPCIPDYLVPNKGPKIIPPKESFVLKLEETASTEKPSSSE